METTPRQGRARVPTYARRVLVGVLVLTMLVVAARGLWGLDAVQDFVERYPGTASGAAWEGNPVWVCVLHAANLFLVVSLVRSALLVRSARQPVRRWTRRGRPLPAQEEGSARTTAGQWLHTSLGVVWLSSGALFVVLMAVSGRWVRLVPTSWDVLPNAASVLLQYLSWHWPDDNTWVAYNALQMLAYGGVVFLLAPLAALTGLRQSTLWPDGAAVNRWFTAGRTWAVHRVVQTLFVVFVAAHLTLVLGTGAVRNLNHMFGARDDTSVLGPHLMVVVLGLAVAAWFAARPVLRALAGPVPHGHAPGPPDETALGDREPGSRSGPESVR